VAVGSSHPSLRERKAQLTREEILRAARHLFAERGYAHTSVRDIAQTAGVSAQTVYDSVGSKQALVAALNDLIDDEAGIGAIAGGLGRTDDPRQLAAMPARITRSILEHCEDIVHALVTGAAAEPELAAVLAEGRRRHIAGTRRIVDRLHQLGALSGDNPSEAADTLAAVTDLRFALVLRESYGWSPERIERWMAATGATLLLRG
jgi:TetR/AcrR family transcriptional regulator, regulator of cefoperazone and chloramphenicol sensitivity